MREAKFRVGDVVRLCSERGLHAVTGPLPRAEFEIPIRVIPNGTLGVVREAPAYHCFEGVPGLRGLCFIAFPEMRGFGLVHATEMDFIEHQPSPEEVATMRAEAR